MQEAPEVRRLSRFSFWHDAMNPENLPAKAQKVIRNFLST
jgi:hypothetical protein